MSSEQERADGNGGVKPAALRMLPEDEPQTPDATHETDALVADPAKTGELRDQIVKELKTVFDPEIPVDIWELGLVYDVFVTADGVAAIRMTLTAPACPAAQYLPGQVGAAARRVPGVADAKVDVVWEPTWTKERMSDVAKLQLGMW